MTNPEGMRKPIQLDTDSCVVMDGKDYAQEMARGTRDLYLPVEGANRLNTLQGFVPQERRTGFKDVHATLADSLR